MSGRPRTGRWGSPMTAKRAVTCGRSARIPAPDVFRRSGLPGPVRCSRRKRRRRARGGDVRPGSAVGLRGRPGPATSVLDAGCGTGWVAIELAGHGIDVVGVDVGVNDRRGPPAGSHPVVGSRRTWPACICAGHSTWRTCDVVVLAGYVPLFTQPATERALVVSYAAHVGGSGALVDGFQLDRTFGWMTTTRAVRPPGSRWRSAGPRGTAPRSRWAGV